MQRMTELLARTGIMAVVLPLAAADRATGIPEEAGRSMGDKRRQCDKVFTGQVRESRLHRSVRCLRRGLHC